MNRRNFLKGFVGVGIALRQIDLASSILIDSLLDIDLEPYSSSYIDSSGRMVVPYSLRKVLNNKRLFIYDGFGPYLVICTETKLNEIKRNLQCLPETFSKEVKQIMVWYSSARETEMDGKGRISIPDESRAYAGIKNNSDIVMVEKNNKVQIWDRNVFLERESSIRTR